ncbi:MAG: sigma-70 family RNA polymerase sigma factor [Candidatus Vogelbacteria bacterium]|nr:sigma-70 family RNA polymerase sigma factor [Candidatus Vogelbacteria bacterium]
MTSARPKATDEALILEAKADPRAFSHIYDKYSRKIYNYFLYRTGFDKELSEDLTQETFVKAFTHLDSYKPRGFPYITYLLTIAHNDLVNSYRNSRTFSLEDSTDGENIPDEALDDAENRNDAEMLWKSIESLPRNEKDILLLRYRKELPIKDIAHIVRKSENAVKLLVRKILKKLKCNEQLLEVVRFTDFSKPKKKANFINP